MINIRSLIGELQEYQLYLVINGGFCGLEPTRVVKLESESPIVTRQGRWNFVK